MMIKLIYFFGFRTPQDQSIKSGLYEIFRAIKENNCSIYQCNFDLPHQQHVSNHHQHNSRRKI